MICLKDFNVLEIGVVSSHTCYFLFWITAEVSIKFENSSKTLSLLREVLKT